MSDETLHTVRHRLIGMLEMRTVAEMQREARKLVDLLHLRLYPPAPLTNRDPGDETDR